MFPSATIATLFIVYVNPIRKYWMEDMGGGPRPLQLRHVVNLQKGSTICVMSLLLFYTKNYQSIGPCIYTALHGSYGIIWILKDIILPDPAWNVYITIPSAMFVALGLFLYWSPGMLLMLADHPPMVSPLRAAVAICMHTIGVVLMMGADTQKYFTLQLKKGLIDHGWLKHSRNTNYLGEILLYSAYAVLAQHWLPWTVYGTFWTLIFGSNMCVKDASLASKEHSMRYFQRSGCLLPNVIAWWRGDDVSATTDTTTTSYVETLASLHQRKRS